MKKISFLLVAAAALSFFSCAQTPKANLKTDIDSLSYATGMARTDGLVNYLVHQMRIDTTFMDEFVKGFNEGSRSYSPKDFAYVAGMQIGQTVSKYWMDDMNMQVFDGDSTKTISRDNMIAGFVAGVTGKNQKMSFMDAQVYSQTALETIKTRALEEEFGDNKQSGEQFLAENKNKDGVHTTESGLQYKIITEGTGAIPQRNDRVKVHYRGRLTDGTEFESSYSNEPLNTRVDQVITGWTEALTMMPVGSKWELYIPQELAYGSRNQGKIQPFSTLIFEVELLEIVQ